MVYRRQMYEKGRTVVGYYITELEDTCCSRYNIKNARYLWENCRHSCRDKQKKKVVSYNLITLGKFEMRVRETMEPFSTKNAIFHIVAKGHGFNFTSMRTHLDNYLPVAESTINRYGLRQFHLLFLGGTTKCNLASEVHLRSIFLFTPLKPFLVLFRSHFWYWNLVR